MVSVAVEIAQREPTAPTLPPPRRSDLPAPEIDMHLAHAHGAFHRNESPAVWGAAFEAALDLLERKDDEQQRMEVLLAFARLLLETWLREGERTITGRVAHLHFLEAANLADRHGQEQPTIWLSILHDLYRLEWWMAQANRKAPPRFGLYLSLAVTHHALAEQLYTQWATPEMREQAQATGNRLRREGKCWATSSGLQGGWEKRTLDPLYGFQLLGLAITFEAEAFVQEHIEAVHTGFAESTEAQVELAVFYEELLEIGQYVDAKAGASVITPWVDAVEEVVS